jgi:hypothetical protein
MLSRDCIAWENQKIIRIATRYNRAAASARAEIVNRPEDYRYSSAIDYTGAKGLLDVVIV